MAGGYSGPTPPRCLRYIALSIALVEVANILGRISTAMIIAVREITSGRVSLEMTIALKAVTSARITNALIIALTENAACRISKELIGKG